MSIYHDVYGIGQMNVLQPAAPAVINEMRTLIQLQCEWRRRIFPNFASNLEFVLARFVVGSYDKVVDGRSEERAYEKG